MATVTAMQSASTKWQTYKPAIWALVIGLLSGPIISNIAGWQTLNSTAQARLADGLVEQQAAYCDAQARVEVAEPGKLDWNARNLLAERFAMMPGSPKPSSSVVSACSRKLAG